MRFEDILPAIRAGRLARRASWKGTQCLGAPEYNMRSGSAESLRVFDLYDRDSSNRGFSHPSVERDLLADDWELIPELPQESNRAAYLKPLITELLVRQETFQKGSDPGKDFLTKALETYRTPSTHTITEALDAGIAWLQELKGSEKLKNLRSYGNPDILD